MLSAAANPPAPTSAISLAQLRKEHPARLFWSKVWANYRLIYEGGEKFIRSAGQTGYSRAVSDSTNTSVADSLFKNGKRRRFLYQLEGEPDVKYNSRWERAYPLSYVGAIVDFHRHWLFSQPPEIRPSVDAGATEQPDAPKWWDEFFEDCTGAGQGLIDFLRDVFLDVLVVQRAGWLLGAPDGAIGSQADAEASGSDGVVLTPYAAEEIIDWERDSAGEYEWLVLRKERETRRFPDDRRRVEIYTYVNRTEWRSWEITGGDDGGESLSEIGSGVHGLGEVPFVAMEVPEGLWPLNKLASWQVDLFNKQSMLSYGQMMGCYMQPALTTHEEGAEARIFGEGIVLNLRGGGKDRDAEKFEWISPDTGPLEFVAAQLKEQRDEGYRIVHQMSLAVDSQAIGAVARSGASKVEDRRASEIILAGYGGYIRDAIIRTANLISRIMGDDTEWECVGFDNFNVSSLEEELQTAALVGTAGIDSPTLKKVMQKTVANRLAGHTDETTRSQIEREIDDSVDAKQEQDDALSAQMTSAAVARATAPAVTPGAPGMPEKPPKPPGPPIPGDKVK